MSRDLVTEAYVLRRVKYGDKDVIVNLLTRDAGKFAAIAKGARSSRRRFGGGLEHLRRLEILYDLKPQRDMAMLKEIKVVSAFHNLETNYDKIALGSYATELANEMTQEGQDTAPLFDLLDGFFHQLDDADDDLVALEVMLRHLQLNILRVMGALPSLRACSRCDTPADPQQAIAASRRGEGLICATCRRAGEAVGILEPATLAVLWFYLAPEVASVPLELMDPDARRQAKRLIEASIVQLVPRQLKTVAMLDTVLS